MNIVGYAAVSDAPSENTRFFFGEIDEIAGKELPVFERNSRGDCLCFVKDKGLVDVDHGDVVYFRSVESNSVIDLISRMLNGAI